MGKGNLPSLLLVWFLFLFVFVFAIGWYLKGIFLTTILLGMSYSDFRDRENGYQGRAAIQPQK